MLSLMSYMHYDMGYNDSKEYIKGFNEDFYKMICDVLPVKNCYVNNKPLDFLYALQESQTKDTAFLQSIFDSAYLKTLKKNGKDYIYMMPSYGGNSIYSLAQTSLIDGTDFISAMANASMQKHQVLNPLVFISLNKDSIVSPNNSDAAYNLIATDYKQWLWPNMPVSLIKVDNKLIQVKPISGNTPTDVDHIQGENFLNLIALDFLEKCGNSGPFKCEYHF